MKTWADFPDFYDNVVIRSIASNPKWTVSDHNKRPINARHMIQTHNVVGATKADATCLVTLREILDYIPNVTNHAYHVDVYEDEFVIVDIEKKADDDTRDWLLGLPYLYGEYSLSGKGYHLILPKPKNFDNFPHATVKKKLQHKEGTYEILLNHYVTFTRNMLPPQKNPRTRIEDVYAELADQASTLNLSNLAAIDTDKPEIPKEDRIFQALHRVKYTPKDVTAYDDLSRLEFGTLMAFANRLERLLKSNEFSGHTYTDTEKAWLLYDLAKNALEPRDKHNEMRNGMPFLLFRAQQALESVTSNNATHQNTYAKEQ